MTGRRRAAAGRCRALLRALVDGAPASALRLDLGAALATAQRGARARAAARRDHAAERPAGERRCRRPTASVPVLVGRPDGAAVPERGDRRARDRAPAVVARRRATSSCRSSATRARRCRSPLRLGDRPAAAGAGAPPAASAAGPPMAGAGRVVDGHGRARSRRVPADDRRVGVVRVAPVARVRWDTAERYVAAACRRAGAEPPHRAGRRGHHRRARPGALDREPPADPAGARRAQPGAGGARVSAGRFGEPVTADGARRTAASSALGGGSLRRYTLGPAGERADRRARDAWAARPGSSASGDVVLLGSRLDPAWTALPVSAGFMPFMDALLNRFARGEVALVGGAPGDPVLLPDRVTEVRRGERELAGRGRRLVPSRANRASTSCSPATTPSARSAANLDPRESRLARGAATPRCGRCGAGRGVGMSRTAPAAAFSAAARGDLRGPLLWSALLLGLAEVGLASAVRRRDAMTSADRARRVRARARGAGPGASAFPRRGAALAARRACPARAAPCWRRGSRGELPAAAPGGHRARRRPTRSDGSATCAQLTDDGGGALSPAGGAGRGRAPLRDRRRAGRDASRRCCAAGSGCWSPRRAPPRSGRWCRRRSSGCALALRAGDAAAARASVVQALERDGIPPGADGDRGGRVQRARRDRRRVRVRHGGTGAARVVGRRHLVDPRVRPHHPAVAGGARPTITRAAGPKRPGAVHTADSAHATTCPTRRVPTLLELLPADTLIIEEARGPTRTRWSAPGARRRTTSRWPGGWARRSPRREDLFEPPAGWQARLAGFPRLVLRDEPADLQIGLLPAREGRPRPEPAARPAGGAAADADPLRQRGPAGAARRAARGRRPAVGGRDARRRRARRRLRHARRSGSSPTTRSSAAPGGCAAPAATARPRRRPPRARSPWATTSCISTTASGSIAASTRSPSAAARSRWRCVEYEGGDRLNVPLYRLDQLERYRAAGDDGDRPPPRLHRLGGAQLAAGPREDPRRRSRQMAGRAARPLRPARGHRPATPSRPTPAGSASWSRASSTRTRPTSARRPRTSSATWSSPRPMDRLLVGDVGYGKTEVAVRAAFKAVQGGKQVAVLVPTTILAEQHGRTFVERLADYPGQGRGAVALPHRRRSRRQALARLATGRDRHRDRHPPPALHGRASSRTSAC